MEGEKERMGFGNGGMKPGKAEKKDSTALP